MKPIRVVVAMTLLLPIAAAAQTANGSPTDAAPRGPIGTPRSVSRVAPSMGTGRAGPRAVVPGLGAQGAAPKETAAERADRLKLEHDLRICIGC